MNPRKQLWIVVIVLLVAVLTFNACAPPEEEAAPEEEQLLFVYVTQNPLGSDIIMLEAKRGLEEIAQEHNAVALTYESEDLTAAEENVRAAVAEGADIIMLMFFDMLDIVSRVAPEAPEVDFLFLDQCPEEPPPNVYCVLFKEHEVNFLLGIEAGMLTETNKIAVIGPIDIPFFNRYTHAFRDGALSVNPDVEFEVLYIGGDNPFQDPARGKELGLTLAARGADHIFAVGAESNFGIFEAAEEEGFYVYGVNVNECPTAPGHIVDNSLKLYDMVVLNSVPLILDGTHPPIMEYGLGEGGIGVVPFDWENPEESQCLVMDHPDVIDKVGEIRQQIINGELELEDPMFAEE